MNRLICSIFVMLFAVSLLAVSLCMTALVAYPELPFELRLMLAFVALLSAASAYKAHDELRAEGYAGDPDERSRLIVRPRDGVQTGVGGVIGHGEYDVLLGGRPVENVREVRVRLDAGGQVTTELHLAGEAQISGDFATEYVKLKDIPPYVLAVQGNISQDVVEEVRRQWDRFRLREKETDPNAKTLKDC